MKHDAQDKHKTEPTLVDDVLKITVSHVQPGHYGHAFLRRTIAFTAMHSSMLMPTE